MKVLFVTNGFPPRGRWGTEFYTWQLVGGLVERGIEVVILHPVRDGSRPRYTLERVQAPLPSTTDGTPTLMAPVYLLHNAGDPAKSFRASYQDIGVEDIFAEVLEREAPDIVHFTYLLWGLSVGLPSVAKRFGVPTVVTLTDYGLLCHRGQMFDWKLQRCEGPHPAKACARCVREPSEFDESRFKLGLRRLLVRTAACLWGLGHVVVERDLAAREAAVRSALDDVDHFIAPTHVFARTFVAFGIEEERLTKLLYSFEQESYKVAWPEPSRPSATSPIRFGFMGQFTPHKGLDTLVEATRIMQSRLPESVEPWRVHLFGRPLGGRHRLFAERILGGELGPRLVVEEPFEPHEAPEVLASLNAVVVPSKWDENAPLTILQARAAGVPVIGSDMEGIEEVVEAPLHGRIFPAGDASALADMMREVILGDLGRPSEMRLPNDFDGHLDTIVGVYRRISIGYSPGVLPC